MPRKRTATVERVTTERVTLTEHDDTAPIHWAPGPRRMAPLSARAWNAQRREQVWRAAQIVVAAADSGVAVLDEGTLRQAVTILRALPGASPLELTMGRSA